MNDQLVEYHKLRPGQLLKRRKQNPVAYLGIGILEWHGLHNPLGLDGVKAHGIACHLAKKFGGVAMPPLFWGENRRDICELQYDPEVIDVPADHTQKICDHVKLPKEAFLKDAQRSMDNGGWRLWQELTEHIFFQLETLGFSTIIPIPGHYPLFDPLDNAIASYHQNGGKSRIFVLKDTMFSEDGTSGDHAAAFETSLMLALYPDLVDLTQLSADLADPNIGVLGQDPRLHATREFGVEILTRFEQIISDYLSRQSISPR